MTMDSLWSLAQIVAGFALSLALGFGVSYSLLPAQARRYAILISPTAGYATFCLAAITISGNFDLPANHAVWYAFVPLLAFSAWATHLAIRRDELAGLWSASKSLAWPMLLMLVVMFWPAVYQGVELYLGTANPDFYQSLSYQEALAHGNLSAMAPRPAGDYSLNPFFGMFPDPLPAKFGAVMFALLQQELLGLSARAALLTALIVFLLGFPPVSYFFCRMVLEMNHRTALTSAFLVAISGPVSMSFVHVLVGQNSSLALLPLCLAVSYLAVRMRDWRLLALASILVAATFWIYVMILPYVLAPLGLYLVYELANDRARFTKWLLRASAAALVAALLMHAGMLAETTQLLADIFNLLGTSNKRVYLDFLTEMSVPYSLGISSYPANSSYFVYEYGHLFNPSVLLYAGVGFALVVSAFYFHSVAVWARQASPGSRVFATITLAVYVAVLVYFSVVSLYGYAIFKMASWLQFFFIPFIAYGFQSAIAAPTPGSRRVSKARIALASAITAGYVAGNLVSTTEFGIKSLGKDTHRGALINSYGIGGNDDYRELAAALPRFVKPGEVVGIAMTDFIANLWSAYYVAKAGLPAAFVSHDDFPDEDAVLPDVLTGLVQNSAGNADTYRPRYFNGGHADYYLLSARGNLNQEVVEQRGVQDALWSNDSFVLVRADKAKEILVTGRGFYRLEYFDVETLSWWWPGKMRWTAEGGEIFLLNASRPQVAHYLSFVGIAGSERAMPRTVELWLNGQLIDEMVLQSAARLVSKPFYPTGTRDKLVIRIKERVALEPRNFGLWNRHIALDQRFLNLVIAQVKVLQEGDPAIPAAGFLPAKKILDASSRFNGISLDGWAGPHSYFELPVQPGAGNMTLSIHIPGWARFDFPFAVAFKVNGATIEKRFDNPGEHSVELEIGAGTGTVLVEMDSKQSARIPGVGIGSFVIKSLAIR